MKEFNEKILDIANSLSMAVEAVKSLEKDIIDFIVNSGNFLNAIAGIGSFILAIKDCKKTVLTELNTISNAFNSEGASVSAALGKIAGAMSAELTKPITEELSSMSKILNNISENIGESISNGIVEGLKGGVKRVREFSQLVCDDGIITEMKECLEIHSPSKVMKRIGGYISEGLEEGIKDGSKDVEKAMRGMTDTVEDSAKKSSKVKFSFGGIAAVAGIVASLVSYFVDMMSTNEELNGKMQEIWAAITEAFAPVIEVVTNLFTTFTSGGEGTCSMFDTIMGIVGSLAEFIAEVITTVVTFFQENGQAIMAAVSGIWEFISGIIATVVPVFMELFGVIIGFFKENGDTIMDVVTMIWSFISSIINGAVSVFKSIFDIVVGIFTGNGEKIKEGFAGIWEGIKSIFSGIFGTRWCPYLPKSVLKLAMR